MARRKKSEQAAEAVQVEERSSDERRTRLRQMQSVAERFKSWRPAKEVLTRVRALPTIFPQLDWKTHCGGWPLQRFALIHGPSNHGKTTFVHGLGLSFLQSGHWYAYIDAEFTTPEDWLVRLMAAHSDDPGFIALRPTSYENVVEAVREFAETIAEAREKGKLPPDTTGFAVVDSIRKLVPERLLEKIAKGEGGIDGAGGRAAMMRAAINAQWLDELTPLLYHSGISLAFISRETENPDSSPWAPEFKVGGGKALEYDSSLVCRITRAQWLKDGEDIIGERHRVTIRKTKVGPKEDKQEQAHFHTSNGKLVPEGFDRARDVLELAVELGVVQKAGAWLRVGDHKLGHGENEAVKRLGADANLLEEIESMTRARMGS